MEFHLQPAFWRSHIQGDSGRSSEAGWEENESIRQESPASSLSSSDCQAIWELREINDSLWAGTWHFYCLNADNFIVLLWCANYFDFMIPIFILPAITEYIWMAAFDIFRNSFHFTFIIYVCILYKLPLHRTTHWVLSQVWEILLSTCRQLCDMVMLHKLLLWPHGYNISLTCMQAWKVQRKHLSASPNIRK